LVFTLHFHAFAFTLISLLLLFRSYLPNPVLAIMIIYIPIYLFLSMKHYYSQGFFKTLIKYILLFFGYFMLTIIMLFITMAVIFVLF